MCFASHLVRRNELQSPGFLAAPAKFASETKRRNYLGSARTRLSLVPREMPIKPNMPDFGRTLRGISERADWVADDAVRCELLSDEVGLMTASLSNLISG